IVKLRTILAEDFPSIRAKVDRLFLGPPTGWPVQMRVMGPDRAEVRRIADEVKARFAKNPMLGAIHDDWLEPVPAMKLVIDQDRARALGVRFVRGLPGEVQRSATGPLRLPVEDTFTGEMLVLEPDLVVLSIGLQPSAGVKGLADVVGIDLEETGFYRSADDLFNAVEAGRGGIYLAGAGLGPRDIPDSVAQAGAAAVRACLDAFKVA
ncbi:MAG TPA: hypothetical protein PLI31_01880, partial [Methanoregulaceae archaeon]|nr:hypothetical protein [Methanoregulaceae archaeon]